jgi:hypothetical protein
MANVCLRPPGLCPAYCPHRFTSPRIASFVGRARVRLALLLAIIGGVLLVAAGFALRHAHAIWARNAAIVCLALFILARTLAPWMSIASTVIGVVVPLALLVWTTRRRSSAVSV